MSWHKKWASGTSTKNELLAQNTHFSHAWKNTLSTNTHKVRKDKKVPHAIITLFLPARFESHRSWYEIPCPGQGFLKSLAWVPIRAAKWAWDRPGGGCNTPPSVRERGVQGASQYWCARDPCTSTECDNQGWVCGTRSPAGPMPILLSTNWNRSRALSPSEIATYVRVLTHWLVSAGFRQSCLRTDLFPHALDSRPRQPALPITGVATRAFRLCLPDNILYLAIRGYLMLPNLCVIECSDGVVFLLHPPHPLYQLPAPLPDSSNLIRIVLTCGLSCSCDRWG